MASSREDGKWHWWTTDVSGFVYQDTSLGAYYAFDSIGAVPSIRSIAAGNQDVITVMYYDFFGNLAAVNGNAQRWFGYAGGTGYLTDPNTSQLWFVGGLVHTFDWHPLVGTVWR